MALKARGRAWHRHLNIFINPLLDIVIFDTIMIRDHSPRFAIDPENHGEHFNRYIKNDRFIFVRFAINGGEKHGVVELNSQLAPEVFHIDTVTTLRGIKYDEPVFIAECFIFIGKDPVFISIFKITFIYFMYVGENRI